MSKLLGFLGVLDSLPNLGLGKILLVSREQLLSFGLLALLRHHDLHKLLASHGRDYQGKWQVFVNLVLLKFSVTQVLFEYIKIYCNLLLKNSWKVVLFFPKVVWDWEWSLPSKISRNSSNSIFPFPLSSYYWTISLTSFLFFASPRVMKGSSNSLIMM